MKLAIGFLVGFLAGAACRDFDIPVGSPPVLPGAMRVVAMTLAYTSVVHIGSREGHAATTERFAAALFRPMTPFVPEAPPDWEP